MNNLAMLDARAQFYRPRTGNVLTVHYVNYGPFGGACDCAFRHHNRIIECAYAHRDTLELPWNQPAFGIRKHRACLSCAGFGIDGAPGEVARALAFIALAAGQEAIRVPLLVIARIARIAARCSVASSSGREKST